MELTVVVKLGTPRSVAEMVREKRGWLSLSRADERKRTPVWLSRVNVCSAGRSKSEREEREGKVQPLTLWFRLLKFNGIDYISITARVSISSQYVDDTGVDWQSLRYLDRVGWLLEHWRVVINV